MKRVQWPPSAGGNIIDDAVDGQPNVEQSNTNQPDDAVQDETIQPADEQLNQVAQETQKEPCDPIQVQVEADEKVIFMICILAESLPSADGKVGACQF